MLKNIRPINEYNKGIKFPVLWCLNQKDRSYDEEE